MNNIKKKELLKLALSEHRSGNLDSADKIYLDILKEDDNDFDANHLHGTILSQNKKYAESIAFFSRAYESSQPTCELLNNYAIALRNVHAYSECERMLQEALTLDNEFPNTYLNLSNCYLSQSRYDDAVKVLTKSIKSGMNILRCQTEIVAIHFTSLNEEFSDITLSKLKKSLDSLSKSDDASSISKSALIYHNIGDLDRALELFKKSEKIYSDLIPSIHTLKNMGNKSVIETFLRHEYQQINHIDSDEDGIRNMKITQDYYDNLKRVSSKMSSDYNDEDYKYISQFHKIKYNKPPKVQKNYINTDIDYARIEKSYCESNPEIVVVDNFLSESFLQELRVFFRCANIFKYPYSRGYIGAFLGKGMANRAFLEFSNHLKKSFKKIFLNYYLSQAWAFKYDSKREGIGIHADDARVNVNFWITQDNANLNKANGGMIVWKKKPDLEASFKEFNSIESMKKMTNEVRNSDYVKIPYKSNRAVIFNSKLYHATDKIQFDDNYKDRRVNITFLYK